jgi:hypothetical protein
MFRKKLITISFIILSAPSFALDPVAPQAFFCSGAATSIYNLTLRFGKTQTDLTSTKSEKDFLNIIDTDRSAIIAFGKNNEIFTKRLVNFSSSKMDVIRFFKFSPLIDQTNTKLKNISDKKGAAKEKAQEFRNASIDFYVAARMLYETECGPYKPEIIL